MGLPAEYKLEPMLRGDQWRGIAQIGPLTINGEAPGVALASARMQFRKFAGAPLVGFEIGTGSIGGITITDAAAWIMTIPPRPLPLNPGVWHWDLQTTDASGAVKTYLRGTLTISPDTTR